MSAAETPARVLVTGSRDWPDHTLIRDVLYGYRRVALGPGRAMVVVHGAARGVDTFADAWAKEHDGVEPEAHRYFGHLGRRGGHARNELMVRLGADVCLAFVWAGSWGATGCARAAHAAGIKTYVWRDECPSETTRRRRCSARCRHLWTDED